jgi:hypothetical protein
MATNEPSTDPYFQSIYKLQDDVARLKESRDRLFAIVELQQRERQQHGMHEQHMTPACISALEAATPRRDIVQYVLDWMA